MIAARSRSALTLDRRCDTQTSRNVRVLKVRRKISLRRTSKAGREIRQGSRTSVALVYVELMFSKRHDSSDHVRLRTREDRGTNTMCAPHKSHSVSRHRLVAMLCLYIILYWTARFGKRERTPDVSSNESPNTSNDVTHPPCESRRLLRFNSEKNDRRASQRSRSVFHIRSRSRTGRTRHE